MDTLERTNRWSSLIRTAKSGCDLAMDQLVTQFEAYALLVAESHINGSLQSKFGASDIVQMSLMEAHESIDQFDGSSESQFRVWLRRIVINNLLDQSKQFTKTRKRAIAREDSTTNVVLQPSKQQTPSSILSRKESDHELRKLVDELPERQRFVVEARHRFGLSYFSIAQQLKMSEANARQLWSRAIKSLRQDLEKCQSEILKYEPQDASCLCPPKKNH